MLFLSCCSTIISRTQRFDFYRIDDNKIAEHLGKIAEKEGIKFEADALKLIAKQSAGGMRDAIGMLEQLGSGGEVLAKAVAQNLGLTKPKAVEDFVFALLFKRLPEALETISGLVREGVNWIQFNKTVLVKLRDIMLQKVAENKLPEAKGVLEIIEEFTCANEELKNAVIPQLPLEVATISICSRKLVASSSQFTEVESKKVEMKKKVEVKVEERLEKKGVLEEKSEFEK